jgi:hypothetical protein
MSIRKRTYLAFFCVIFLAGCVSTQRSQYDSQVQSSTTRMVLPSASVGNCKAGVVDLLAGTDEDMHLSGNWPRYNWQRVYEKCPDSKVAAHNYALQLLQKGDWKKARQVVQEGLVIDSGFLPLSQLAQGIDDPTQAARTLADSKYNHWLNEPSQYSFTLTPPRKESPSSLPKLIKGEFEKRNDFETRVRKAKMERRQELQGIEDRYVGAVALFNAAVASHNAKLKKEKDARLAKRQHMREKFFNGAVADVYGDLTLTDLVYDSESEKFTGLLLASSANFREPVSISVPLANGKAKLFKQDIASLKPFLKYSLTSDGKATRKPIVYHGNHSYVMEFNAALNQPLQMSAVANVVFETEKSISPIAKVQEKIAIEDDYYAEALSVQDDPALAKLRQEKVENERKLALARAEKARERERQRITTEIRSQQQQLADMGGSVGSEYKGLKEKYSWNFNRGRDKGRDMVAVIIGNRSYGRDIPMVHYAHNDATAMAKFLREGLGVAPENIIVQKDATKGEMEGLFLRTLPNRVKRGKTEVFFYFSGHGMPKDGKALLLASDTRPEYADITGYSRDELLLQLADLGAKNTTVIVDACFSGTAKDSAPLIAGKPVFAEVQQVAIPDDTIFISATSAREIARMDKEKGMSLMTFYLLQGLTGKADSNGDMAISVGEVKSYLARAVPKAARLSFDAEQTPEVYGPAGYNIIRY